tara:strand:+ start:215 stop:331 length:117 start_codon:yes stop_codon:yes gene_type:complete
MGSGDNRKTLKMRRRKAQKQKKERVKKLITVTDQETNS